MYFTLLSKDIRFNLLTFRFAAFFVIIFLLSMTSFWVQGDDYLRRIDSYNTSAESSARSDREIYVPSQARPTVHRPPSTLSMFCQGEDRRFGNYLEIKRWIVPKEATGSFNDNPLLVAQPSIDFFTIAAVALSLFGILLGYDGVSGERERGTLKLQLVNSVGRARLFGSKFLGGVLTLAIPLLFSFISGLLLLYFQWGIVFSMAQWGAIALMVAAALLYGSVFVGLSLLCSAMFRRSSVALVLCLLLWTLGALLIPSAAQSVADIVVPLPSPTEMANMDATTANEAIRAYQDFRKRYPNHPWGHMTGSYGFGDGGGSPTVKFDGSEVQFRDAEEYVRFFENLMLNRADSLWDFYKEYLAQRNRQANIADILSFPAPVFQLRKAMTALAGTNYTAYGDFLEEARRYRRELLSGFRSKGYFSHNALGFFSRRPRSEIDDDQLKQRREGYFSGKRTMSLDEAWGYLPENEIPGFTNSGEASPSFDEALGPMGYLFVAASVLFLGGIVLLNRYDVR